MQLCPTVLYFAQSDTILKHELSSEKKAVDCHRTKKNCVHTGTPVSTFVPEYKVSTLHL